MHPFANKQIILATKHDKQKVIAPLFFEHLQASVEVWDFDTDSLGTFTGEIARISTAYETCLKKAKLAASASKDGIGLGNEGSFGPHPAVPMMPCDHEIMILVDLNKNLIISEQILSTKTNYQSLVIDVNSHLDEFLNQVKFPTHALCLLDAQSMAVIAKGIQDYQQLTDHLTQSFTYHSNLLVSTDMRAMMNPSRMKVIAELTEKFLLKAKNLCQQCQTPGFGIGGVEGALPCEVCHFDSSYHAFEIWNCSCCSYQEKKPRSDGMQFASPLYCYFCNP